MSSANGIAMSADKEESSDGNARFFLCEATSIFSKLSVAVACLALTCHVIAMACPYWIVGKIRGVQATHAGLWVECNLLNIFSTREQWVCLSFSASHHLDSLPVFLKATQAMAILGALALFSSSFLLTLYAILPKLKGRKTALYAALVCAAIAGLFGVIGGSVFAENYPTPQDILQLHSWSYDFAFAFHWLASILCLVVVALILVDMRTSQLISRFF